MIDRIVFWGLCAVLIFVPLPIGSVEEWAVFVFEAATIALFLLYLGGQLSKRRPARGATLPLFFKIALGTFLVSAVVQLVPLPVGLVGVLSPREHAIFSGLVRDGVVAPASRLTLSLSPSATVSELLLVLCCVIFGFLVLRTVRTRRRVEVLVVVVLASALFQSFYGMAEVFSGHEAIFGRPKRSSIGSVTGTYVNRNHLAGFLEMAFPLSLGYLLVKARYFAMEKGLSLRRRILWFGQESLQWTFLLGLVPVFIGLALIFSKSRSGIMVLGVTAVLAAVATASWREFSGEGSGRGGTRRFGRIIRIVVMIVLAMAVWLGIGPVIERFSEVDVSAEGRRTFYANTLEMIGDFPLTGTGKGTYVNAYPMYEKVDDRLKLSYAHNDYLEFVSENGIVGGGALIVAGLGLAVWLAAMWRRRRGSFAKGIGLGALLGMTAILIHGFTDFNLQIPANAIYFTTLAMLGAIVLGRELERESEAEEYAASESPKKGQKGDTYPRYMSLLRIIVAALLAAAIFVPAVRDFVGFRHLGAYRRARSEARSVESAFPVLEARLAKAASASPRAVFRVEAARLYVEMARVANDAGREEDRDAFCDKAIAAYNRAIAANPIDAATHFEAATAYLFYNFPLMTYQDRAKAYFRQALVFKPADETMNLTIIFLHFAWWPTLEDADKSYAAGLYRRMIARDPAFPAKLEARWTLSFPTLDGLTAVLAELPR